MNFKTAMIATCAATALTACDKNGNYDPVQASNLRAQTIDAVTDASNAIAKVAGDKPKNYVWIEPASVNDERTVVLNACAVRAIDMNMPKHGEFEAGLMPTMYSKPHSVFVQGTRSQQFGTQAGNMVEHTQGGNVTVDQGTTTMSWVINAAYPQSPREVTSIITLNNNDMSVEAKKTEAGPLAKASIVTEATRKNTKLAGDFARCVNKTAPQPK